VSAAHVTGDEQVRLDWLEGRVPPADARGTQASTSVAHRADATNTVNAFARLLATIHGLDRADCPFVVDVADLASAAVDRVRHGEVPTDPAYRHVDAERLAQLLEAGIANHASSLRPVVCHGRPTLDDLVIDERGRPALRNWGSLGVADPCLDLAAASRSVARSFAPSFVGPFLVEYEARSDRRIDLVALDWFQLLDALR
jgi:aminoglycoside phosphotransferase